MSHISYAAQSEPGFQKRDSIVLISFFHPFEAQAVFLSARILINCCKGGFILRSMKACLFPPISYPNLGHMRAEMCLCYTLPKTMHSSQYGVLALLCQDVSFTSSSEQCTSNCQYPWESILEDKFSGVLKPQFL